MRPLVRSAPWLLILMFEALGCTSERETASIATNSQPDASDDVAVPADPDAGAPDAADVDDTGVDSAVVDAADADAPNADAPYAQVAPDFHIPGTQWGDVDPTRFESPFVCAECHAFSEDTSPYFGWVGSLMGQGGRDPLFFAQLTNANQDAPGVGYYCQRCHVPVSIVTGNGLEPWGRRLNARDQEGVTCATCHYMVDPIYEEGKSPSRDQELLARLADPPKFYGNSMFVLDPEGPRRGPYQIDQTRHDTLQSSFMRSGDLCGTCHDVGNVAVSKQSDGTYRYNISNEPAPSSDPISQFPLERTYTEWKLSEFAKTGVDMGGRFGGEGATVLRTCQDCHMPRKAGAGCIYANARSDLAQHDFAGAASWVLEIIGEKYKSDPTVDQAALLRGRTNAESMLKRAVSLDASQGLGKLSVRITNESGHKFPTGHIEGRRAWLNVRLLDGEGRLLREYGAYDPSSAELDESTTTVFEMHVGLSAEAAAVTGKPEGVTTHMSLADTIVKDNRIPPRGFNNASYRAAGAPVVAGEYADGQYWSDREFELVPGTARAEVRAFYQIVTKHYIEALRDGNVTDGRGEELEQLWLSTNKAPPFEMAKRDVEIQAW